MYKYQLINKLMVGMQKKGKPTQAEIAIALGISLQSFHDYRNGKTNPPADSAEAIALYFKKDMNYFFDLDYTKLERTSITEEAKADYGIDNNKQRILQLEEQNALLRSVNEDQAAMLLAFRTGAIKFVEPPLGNDKNGMCG